MRPLHSRLVTLGSSALAVLGWAALPVVTTACDINPLKTAIDTLQITVELPKINTVIAGQVIDAGTRAPLRVPVMLTFSGPQGGQLIDAYSEPITSLRLTSGVATLGLRNAVVPSVANPVTFTVTASAAGFQTRTQTVVLTSTEAPAFTISLPTSNFTVPIPGTAAASGAAGTVTAGTVATTTTVTTGPLPGATTASSVTVNQGAQLSTVTGTPLTGALTASLRVFGTQGFAALADEVLFGGGVLQPVIAAVEIQMRDAAGNVAALPAAAASSLGGAGLRLVGSSSAAAMAVTGISAFIGLSQAEFDRLQAAVAAGSVLRVFSGDAAAAGCAATIDTPRRGLALAGACAGVLTVRAQPQSPPSTCRPGFLFVTNPNSAVLFVGTATLTSPTVSISRYVGEDSFLRDDIPLSSWFPGGQIPAGSNYTMTIETDAGPAVLAGFNPCSPGGARLVLPSINQLSNVTVAGTVSCPSGQRFDPQVTSSSLSAISVFFRQEGSSQAMRFLSGSSLTRQAAPGSIQVTGTARMTRGTTQEIEVVFGDKSGRRAVAIPASGNATITLSGSDIGLKCK